jgi:hypothetical protein
MMVKENDSPKLIRSQNSVWLLRASCMARYDWEYLVEERSCELVALIGTSLYRLFCFILFSFFKFWFSVRGYLVITLWHSRFLSYQISQTIGWLLK